MLTNGKKIWGIKDPTGKWIKGNRGEIICYDDIEFANAQCQSFNDGGTPMYKVCPLNSNTAQPYLEKIPMETKAA